MLTCRTYVCAYIHVHMDLCMYMAMRERLLQLQGKFTVSYKSFIALSEISLGSYICKTGLVVGLNTTRSIIVFPLKYFAIYNMKVCTSTYVCACMYLCKYACPTCMYIHISITCHTYNYVFMYKYIHACMHVCTYVCIHTYTCVLYLVPFYT